MTESRTEIFTYYLIRLGKMEKAVRIEGKLAWIAVILAVLAIPIVLTVMVLSVLELAL